MRKVMRDHLRNAYLIPIKDETRFEVLVEKMIEGNDEAKEAFADLFAHRVFEYKNRQILEDE